MSRKLPSKSNLDKRILNRLQQGLPLIEYPFAKIATELQIKECLLLKRIAFLKKSGLIRRIAAVFTPASIGWSSTLVAAKVCPKNIKMAVEIINALPEVTHHYKRNSQYNLWFALVGRNKKRINQIISSLKNSKVAMDLQEFPALRVFKINASFRV